MSPIEAPHPSDDHLVDLECDLLDPSTRGAAVEHLRACAGCERRFLEVHRGAERLILRHPWRTGSAVPRRWLVGATAAALLVAGLLAAFELSSGRAPDGLDYWLPLDSERLMLRSAPAPDDNGRYLQAVEAYGRRDIKRVIELFGEDPIPPAYEPLNLVLASALVWNGRHTEAQSLLERLDIETLPQPARDRARWMLYVSLRRDGRSEEARRVVIGLAAAPGEFMDRARAQLR